MEKRRGYMLQPQTMLTMQSFMERVWGTEGVTPEMLARQQKQVELLRTLAMAGAARSAFRPDVPTLTELGFPVEMASERGIVAPAGTPPAILQRLREAMADVIRDPEFVRVMRERFTEPRYEEGAAWFTRLAGLQGNYRTLWQRTPWSQR